MRRAPGAPGAAGTALTLRYQLTVHGGQVRQVQYATSRYVITDVGAQRLLFDRARSAEDGRGSRYLVDEATRTLRPLDASAQVAQLRQLRAELGAPAAACREVNVVVAGYTCRHLVAGIDHPKLVVSGDVYVAEVAGVSDTALHHERSLQADAQPFILPLERGEIVIASTMRVLARSMELMQTLRLESLERAIPERARLEACLDYPVVP